jgi:hypothetical protein
LLQYVITAKVAFRLKKVYNNIINTNLRRLLVVKTANTSPDDAFERALILNQEVMTADPVAKGEVTDSLQGLEQAGLTMLGGDPSQTKRVGEALVGAFDVITEANIEPPLTDEQRNYYFGKALTYRALIDSQPQAGRKTKEGPTDTEAIATDKPKK